MPRFILHLHHRDGEAVALWGQKVDDAGRARSVESFVECLEGDPDLFSPAPVWMARPMRHRARLSDGRSPRAFELTGVRLASVVAALRQRIEELGQRSASRPTDSEADLDALIVSLAEQGQRLALSSTVIADPSVLRVLRVDIAARGLVAQRQVVPTFAPAQFGATAMWSLAPGADGPGPGTLSRSDRAMCTVLVDARARVEFGRAREERERAGALVASESLEALDQVGAALVEALGPENAGIALEPHVRRRLTALVERYVNSGLTGVLLKDREPRLAVRVREPVASTEAQSGEGEAAARATWLVEVCLKEASGTVHPLADLVRATDVSVADALQSTVRVRTHAATLSSVPPSASGYAWELSTREVSAFLSADALALEGAGIDVLMPREWAKKSVQVRAQVEAETEAGAATEKRGTGMSQAIGNFRFRVAIGDVELTEEEAEALLEEQAELVKLRGEWVRVDSATLKAAETFLTAFAQAESITGDPNLRRAITASRMQRGSWGSTARGADGGEKHTDSEPDLLSSRRVGANEFQELLRTPGLGPLDVDISAASPETPTEESTGLEALFGAKVDLPKLPPPSGLRATLRPYQQRGLDWLTFLDAHGRGGILADDMGLGKTMQVLALLVREREDPRGLGWGTRVGGPTLLVCPMSVLGSWQREAATFAPNLTVHVHHGGERLRGERLRRVVSGSDLIITTYALVVRDAEALGSIDFHRVILDEAQHVKNADTLVSQAVRALPQGRRLALTGTPVENDLTDLHSIMQVTNPGLLPESEREFKERFATPIGEGDEEAQAALTRLIEPYVLRRVKTDRAIITDLPEKREERAFVNITPEQAALYQALVDDMQEQLAASPTTPKSGGSEQAGGQAGFKKRSIVASTLMKMKQVLGHPAHFLADGSPILDGGEHRSGKMERIDDLLSAIVANNEKALIFTQFTNFAPAMLAHWERTFGIDLPFLHGGVSKPERDAMVRDFQNSPGRPGAMLLSLRAGGTGITLTAANHVIHLDRWWNPAVENQATDRAFRIGQKRSVEVHKLVSIGTIEEAIDSVLTEKNELAQATIRSGESWLAELDDDALASMFALRGQEGGGSDGR